MKINLNKISEIVFYNVLFNPIMVLFVFLYGPIYLLFFSWIDSKVIFIDEKKYTEFYVNKKQFKKVCIDYLMLIVKICINTYWLNYNKTDAYWTYLKLKYFTKDDYNEFILYGKYNIIQTAYYRYLKYKNKDL